MSHSFTIDSQPLLLENQDGESQTTPANIVSQAEGSIARSTPDYNNNYTFRSTSTFSRQSPEISEESAPIKDAEAGSVNTDSHTPVEREIDQRNNTPMSSPDRESCSQTELKNPQQEQFFTKLRALKSCVNSFIGVTYTEDGKVEIGLLEEIEEPRSGKSFITLTKPMPHDKGTSTTPLVEQIKSFDIIPGECDLIEQIITYAGYEFVVTTNDGNTMQGSNDSIPKMHDHYHMRLITPIPNSKRMSTQQIPPDRFSK